MLLFCLIKRIFTIKKWILILSIMANFKTIAQQNVYTSEDEMRELDEASEADDPSGVSDDTNNVAVEDPPAQIFKNS